ncbi:hypothetical protein [Gordonia terrae]
MTADTMRLISPRTRSGYKLADALRCAAFRGGRQQDEQAVIAAARQISDRPVVINFVASDNELV